ncbi:hypothetical protein V1512DRAFT_258812 [Lipomyces arxii]|uniref:uncharacterized protein n=1 Tax=Lipomyces arxii TaxID=56418 RepID=UPI0034CD410B
MAQSALSAALSALSASSRPQESSASATVVSGGFDMSRLNSSLPSRRQSESLSPRSRPISRPGSTRSFRPIVGSLGSFPLPLNASVPVSPVLFPFSPPDDGVKVLRDRPRRGSSVVTTTILSPYDGELMFSSSFDDRESLPAPASDDEDMDMDMDVDEMDLDYKSDTDEEDWQSAGVESLRRGNAFNLMRKDNMSSSSSSGSDSGFSEVSRESVSSSGTVETKNGVCSQSVPASGIMPIRMLTAARDDRQKREADAIQALVQLRSL